MGNSKDLNQNNIYLIIQAKEKLDIEL